MKKFRFIFDKTSFTHLQPNTMNKRILETSKPETGQLIDAGSHISCLVQLNKLLAEERFAIIDKIRTT